MEKEIKLLEAMLLLAENLTYCDVYKEKLISEIKNIIEAEKREML